MDGQVQYARNGEVELAYRVFGDGPIDVMVVPVWFSNIDLIDQHPIMARALAGLASFSRVILWDRRGSGLSDRLGGPATLEEGMDDLLTVLDTVGADKAALLGFNESGTLSMLTAATHPHRISHLLLFGTFATTTRQPDYPWGQDPEEREMQVRFIAENWGTDVLKPLMFPGASEDLQAWALRWVRSAVSRDAIPRFYDMLAKTDVRHVLPSIRVPTLVMQRSDDYNVVADNGRYIAEKIPGSKYVEFDGFEHIPFLGDWIEVQGEIEEFLTGERRVSVADRVLATILFTDIVDSTGRAAELGDARWREVLDSHDDVVLRQIQRYNGRLIKSTGDGSLALFDGPQRAIRCALSLVQDLSKSGLNVRAGLHTGEVEMRGGDVGGIAIHIGARVMEQAKPCEVLVSGSVPPLVAGSGIRFEPRGAHVLRGVEGDWELSAVAQA